MREEASDRRTASALHKKNIEITISKGTTPLSQLVEPEVTDQQKSWLSLVACLRQANPLWAA